MNTKDIHLEIDELCKLGVCTEQQAKLAKWFDTPDRRDEDGYLSISEYVDGLLISAGVHI